MTKLKYAITDYTTDFADSDQVYVEISKENISEIFSDANEIPRDDMGEENHDFSSGELQFIFDKDEDTLQEILAFPVYEQDDDIVNGESFINIIDRINDETPLMTDISAIMSNVLAKLHDARNTI